MPLTRSKKTLAIIQEEEGKQAIATPEPSAAALTEDEIRPSKDPNRLLLLNILENQKTSDHMHEPEHTDSSFKKYVRSAHS